MFSRNDTRTRKPNRRKTRSGTRKSRRKSIVPALIIESLAVIAILALFFGASADLNNQSRIKSRWEPADDYSQEASLRQDRQVGLLTRSIISTAQEFGADWCCQKVQ